MKITSVLFLLSSVAVVSQELDATSLLKDENYLSKTKGLFESWMEKHEKAYMTSEEALKRLQIFTTNHAMIKEHNSKEPTPSYTLDHNQFSDLTLDEYEAYNKLGSHSPGVLTKNLIKETNNNDIIMDHRSLLNDDVPSEWNWVDEGAVPPVKNQKSCGSCWAFSAIGAIEGARYVDTGNLTALSEQELVDCDKLDNGCGGGLMDNAFLFDENTTHGICSEADYPYVAHKHWFRGCRSKKRLTPSKHYCQSVNHSRVDTFVDIVNTESSLLQAIAKQPVSIAIQANLRSFQFYKKGIYDDVKCGDELDHGVVAVGFGTDEDVAYWLVRNSWGTTWGAKGYIKMARKSTNLNGTCGILSVASVPILMEDDDE